MNAIKNNWGFFLISFICLLVAGYLVMKCSGSMNELRSNQEQYEKNRSYLEGVGKKNLKLNSENQVFAKRNADNTSAKILDVHKEMMERFKLHYDVPENATGAIQELRAAIQDMQKLFEDNGIELDTKAENFSFDNIVKSNQLPVMEDLDPIFRSLTIIRQIVKVAVDTHIIALTDLNRPMGINIQEEGEYTVTPIEMTIVASSERGQAFVNAMSQQKNYLFFLRTVSIDAFDTPTEEAKDLNIKSSSSIGMDSMGGAGRASARRSSRNSESAMDEGGSRRSSRRQARESSRDTGRDRRRSNNMGNDSRLDDDGRVEIPLKRNELIAFEPNKETTWTLRFDFIEPKYELPTDEKEESEEEN